MIVSILGNGQQKRPLILSIQPSSINLHKWFAMRKTFNAWFKSPKHTIKEHLTLNACRTCLQSDNGSWIPLFHYHQPLWKIVKRVHPVSTNFFYCFVFSNPSLPIANCVVEFFSDVSNYNLHRGGEVIFQNWHNDLRYQRSIKSGMILRQTRRCASVAIFYIDNTPKLSL